MGHLTLTSEADFSSEATLLQGVGRLVCAWGALEQSLDRKLADLRAAAGDIRGMGTRNKPAMPRLLAELRAVISMRNRRDPTALAEITHLEQSIQRIDRFRALVIQGFQAPEPGGFICRDPKNNVLHVSIDQLEDEIGQLEEIGERLLSI